MSEHWRSYAYYEGAVEGGAKEATLLLSSAHWFDSRMKQFQSAVKQIREMQSELDRLAAIEARLRKEVERMERHAESMRPPTDSSTGVESTGSDYRDGYLAALDDYGRDLRAILDDTGKEEE